VIDLRWLESANFTGCSDMDLHSKEYFEIESRNLMRTIFTLQYLHCTKECPFTGHQFAMLVIRDAEQQDRTSVSFKFLI
jgi:hypothetical protein